MRIIIAPDSYKGSLTAIEAARAMAAGILDVDSKIETILLPVADGGEGTMEALLTATNGKEYSHTVHDPLGRKMKANFGVLGDGKTCVIEIAQASGLLLLNEAERNPLITCTYGTGELIRYALDAGYRKFIIGLGGSATNDAGMGMLRALGMKFLDKHGDELKPGGGSLIALEKIDLSQFDERIASSRFLIASDVENPFIGEKGSSAVFGPQKGATHDMVAHLDNCLTTFANVVEKETGKSLHDKKGAGAAGGLGGAFFAFFPAEMEQGIGVVLRSMSFHQHVKEADLILTGEGKTDIQTLSGKAPFGIAKKSRENGKPVILISGLIEDTEILQQNFTEVHAMTDGTISKAQSIKNAEKLLRQKTKEVLRTYLKR